MTCMLWLNLASCPSFMHSRQTSDNSCCSPWRT
jgi:hypothetical protein